MRFIVTKNDIFRWTILIVDNVYLHEGSLFDNLIDGAKKQLVLYVLWIFKKSWPETNATLSYIYK